MMKWSSEQLKAINTTDKNIIVSAGAGAGKTAVLIERLTKRIIVDHISVENILAITFTEAAASEIKKRLIESLANAYQQTPTNYLNKQLGLLASANISTIHSFCLYIVKNYYYVLNIDKSLTENILDPTMAQFYQQQAVNQALNQAMIDQQAFNELFYLIASNDLNLTNLKASIISLANTALSNNDHDQWLDDCLHVFEKHDSINDLPIKITNIFWEMIARNYQTYYQAINELAQTCDNEYYDRAYLRLTHAKGILENIQERDYQAYRDNYIDNVKMTIKMKKNASGKSALKQAEETFQAISKHLFSQSIYLEDLHQLYQPSKTLISITKDYIDKYQSIKQEVKMMDFDDMERYALRILQANDQAVAKILRTHFTDILVDEYQDTNIIQDTIINLVKNETNIFRVGDIKQSIYRFRKAKPSIMQALIDDQGSQDEVIFLQHNYRSKSNIIKFNNELFNKLMNVSGLNNRFLNSDEGQPGTDQQAHDHLPIQFHLLDNKLLEDDNRNKQELKADYIAYLITKLHQNDKVAFKDICVLVTTHAIKDKIRNALERRQIPVYGKGSVGLFKSRGVLAILNYLRLINDINDKVALVAVLVSFYRFTDEQLSNLVIADLRLLNGLKTTYPEVYNSIQSMINKQANIKLVDLVNEILMINDYYETLNDQQQKANIDLLLETIIEYEKNSSSLIDFLELINTLELNDLNEALAISEDDDAVKIMTIHQSKGLQFKHVYFFSIDRAKNPRKINSVIDLHSDIGFCLPAVRPEQRIIRSSLMSLIIKEYQRAEELEEQIRVLYVALTRAQNALNLIDFMPKEADHQIDLNTFKSHNYTTWIISALNLITDDLCQINQIESPWDKTTNKRSFVKQVSYPRYLKPCDKNENITPSKTKKQKIDLTLNLTSGFKADIIGTKVHQIFEQLPTTYWTDDDMDPLFDTDTLNFKNAFKTFNDSSLNAQILKMQVKKEVPFVIKSDNGFISGIIDLLATSEDLAIIIDFKTDRHVNKTILIDRYQDQLTLYSKAIQTLYPKLKVKAYLYSLTLETFIEITNR